MSYVIVDVGCIECGATTSIVVVTESILEAERAMREYALERTVELADWRKGFGYFVGEDHEVTLFEWPESTNKGS